MFSILPRPQDYNDMEMKESDEEPRFISHTEEGVSIAFTLGLGF